MIAPNFTRSLKPGYEVVFTIDDYQDGPLRGVANYQGVPHFYECIFDEKQDSYSESFLLTRLDAEVFQAARENWEIFLRWREAYDRGQTGRQTHPALPAEAKKYRDTKELLDQTLASKRGSSIRARGEFEVIGEPERPRGVLSQWQVKWSV